ncbi:MAG: hypothetical protein GFH27_549287n301 [Chloroflexi bacterium AL-W]|nr:hypothetical protein [Chloroflexi bacterium AL-N1]NOK66575.1 hypothetical protein [Chloroflexi bacterium AL-N10]NOK71963.1 hypothetical protein [Chloroflexi bacterium AL-N5]NOK81220.1 hypothetical protein [Chloroflexi bacterium AL-W]NOK89493.1 hypothetical protein [Chloroflexi bacterium AL-N15]
MYTFMTSVFSKVADLPHRSGMLTRAADTLLNQIVPHKDASAVTCYSWQYVGCCGTTSAKYRRYCIPTGHQYKCEGRCFF